MQRKSKKMKILFILSIILLIGILFLGIVCIDKNMSKNKMYQLKNETYYEVTLNPNNYFFNDKLVADNYYIANSIKSVDIYFDYYLNNKSKENGGYSYDITATIKSYADNGTKLVWSKDFNLKNVNNINENEIKINENYKLDYQYYANYVKSFQEYYNIKTESYLYVKLNVKINNEDNPYVSLTIPINDSIVEITMEEDKAFLENNRQNINLKKIIFFIILAVVSVYLVSKILFNKNNEKAILKSYQDVIITVQNEPNFNIYNSIYLTSLKDLVNIVSNNNSNIFNYQNIYYTIIDNIYYIYNFKKRYEN